jgi:hypothetical protein
MTDDELVDRDLVEVRRKHLLEAARNMMADLRAANDQLRHERDHFRDCISAKEVRRIVDERDAARAELVGAKKDAERYRWLRRDAPYDECAAVFDKHSGEDLDQAIDAAIAAKEKQE